jgi:hypothetical protein
MKTNLRSVPPSGKFEMDRREMIVGADLLDILTTMPLDQKFIRKNMIFEAQNDADVLAEFERKRIQFLSEIGLKQKPTVIINFDSPKCLPDLALGTLAKILEYFKEMEGASVIWTASKSEGEHNLLEMILEVE